MLACPITLKPFGWVTKRKKYLFFDPKLVYLNTDNFRNIFWNLNLQKRTKIWRYNFQLHDYGYLIYPYMRFSAPWLWISHLSLYEIFSSMIMDISFILISWDFQLHNYESRLTVSHDLILYLYIRCKQLNLDELAFSQGSHLMANKRCQLPDGSYR